MRGRVVRIAGKTTDVQSPEGLYCCTFRGRLKQGPRDATRLAAVGDEAEFQVTGPREGIIDQILPRRSKLSRPDAGSARREQVIMANIDVAVIVQAAARPDLDLLTLDKCTVMTQATGLPAVICINKSDLAPSAQADFYPAAGYPLFRTSAATGAGVAELRAFLEGKVSVFLGPSGVGKSSLLNALAPGKDLRTGDVSRKTGEGRHTTTWVELHDLGGGTFVGDTPGLEAFTFWKVDAGNLREQFPEFEELAPSCKFRDCRHRREPKCAVLAAVGEGRIAASRHASYLRILELLESKADPFGP